MVLRGGLRLIPEQATKDIVDRVALGVSLSASFQQCSTLLLHSCAIDAI
jgi:hypothetical protein